MRRAFATLAFVLGALGVAGGCGREDVELALPVIGPGGDGGNVAPREGGTSVCDAGVARACRALDQACQLDAECCSGRCESGVCLPAGACHGPGAACAGSAECCSARCEPVVGTTNRACAALCKAAGAACASAQECCSTGCIGGVCTDRLCVREGEGCAGSAECCSGVCEGSRCRVDAVALCRPTGEDCNSGGGRPCCFGCEDGRCGPGPGACRPRTAPCNLDGECCSGTCSASGDARACGGACGAEGAACTAASDCCSGACSASPGVCVAAASAACGVLGDACSAGDRCCSGVCLDGRCAANCGALR